jgi:hypothetical protein
MTNANLMSAVFNMNADHMKNGEPEAPVPFGGEIGVDPDLLPLHQLEEGRILQPILNAETVFFPKADFQ